MLNEKIIDLETGAEIIREYSAGEIAEVDKAKLEAEKLITENETKILAKKAIFEKLGLSKAEIELLIN